MAAFVRADGIELDVHFSKDDELVVIHDLRVDRTTGGRGLVRQHPFKELRKLDAGSYFSSEFKGEKIPHFTEVLNWLVETDLFLNIELKYHSLDYVHFEERVLKEISKRRLKNRTIISSFNHGALKKINKWMPRVETAILSMARLYKPWKYAEMVGAKEFGKLYAGDTDRKHYLLSPIYGELEGLAEISLFIGTRELILPDARKFHRLAREQKIKINYYEYPGMNHVFPVYPIPEAKEARKMIVEIINQG